jgi:hypothetical protein
MREEVEKMASPERRPWHQPKTHLLLIFVLLAATYTVAQSIGFNFAVRDLGSGEAAAHLFGGHRTEAEADLPADTAPEEALGGLGHILAGLPVEMAQEATAMAENGETAPAAKGPADEAEWGRWRSMWTTAKPQLRQARRWIEHGTKRALGRLIRWWVKRIELAVSAQFMPGANL